MWVRSRRPAPAASMTTLWGALGGGIGAILHCPRPWWGFFWGGCYNAGYAGGCFGFLGGRFGRFGRAVVEAGAVGVAVAVPAPWVTVVVTVVQISSVVPDGNFEVLAHSARRVDTALSVLIYVFSVILALAAWFGWKTYPQFKRDVAERVRRDIINDGAMRAWVHDWLSKDLGNAREARDTDIKIKMGERDGRRVDDGKG